jgi:hypothetical protein
MTFLKCMLLFYNKSLGDTVTETMCYTQQFIKSQKVCVQTNILNEALETSDST